MKIIISDISSVYVYIWTYDGIIRDPRTNRGCKSILRQIIYG